MPNKVYLIGISNLDIYQIKRCAIAFHKFEPEVISLEGKEGYIEEIEKSISTVFSAEEKLRVDNKFPPLTEINRLITESLLGGFLLAAKMYTNHGARLSFVENESHLMERFSEEVLADIPQTEKEDEWNFFLKNPGAIQDIIMRALGKQRVGEFRLLGATFPDTIYRQGPLRLTLRGSPNEIVAAQEFLDCIYFIPRQGVSDSNEDFNVTAAIKLDEVIIEKISSLEGKVVHLTGMLNAFGPYQNLYKRLRSIGIPVDRFRLVDFYYENRQQALEYERNLRKKLERWRLGRTMPEVSYEYIEAYRISHPDEKERRLKDALQHMEQWNNVLYDVTTQVSQVLDIRNPALFQRATSDMYMALRDHIKPMPTISREEYKELEELLLRPSSDIVLEGIKLTIAVENPHLHKYMENFVLQRIEDPRHLNGALVTYKLIRDEYLEQSQQ